MMPTNFSIWYKQRFSADIFHSVQEVLINSLHTMYSAAI
jgi:hypothetical protein